MTCVVCRSLAKTRSGEELFFAGYTFGAEDSGALSGHEHAMCEEHGAMRDRMLDALEEKSA